MEYNEVWEQDENKLQACLSVTFFGLFFYLSDKSDCNQVQKQ